MVTNLKQAETKGGKPYVIITGCDKTGSMDFKVWDKDLRACGSVAPNTVCDFSIYTEEYQGKVSCMIQEINDVITDPNMVDFVKASQYDPEGMWTKFSLFIGNLEEKYFQPVAKAMFTEETKKAFMLAPAATGMHHAFYHGLLEHTLQMLNCGHALLQLPFFQGVLDYDLCMFGIMFHDFGKIFEYSTDPGFKKRPQGILVPHIPMCAAMIYENANKLGVPETVRDYMMHVVLAHHRLIEWGSPVKPACPEAVFVHHVDNLHGDTFGAIQAREAGTGESVRYGYGDQQYTLLKKSFKEVMKELEGVQDGF